MASLFMRILWGRGYKLGVTETVTDFYAKSIPLKMQPIITHMKGTTTSQQMPVLSLL
jgi:hypothetical protein